MSELQFEHLEDEAIENEVLPPLSPFKASAILYVVSGLFLFLGVIIPLPDMVKRYHTIPTDTFIELLEWNPFSQAGALGIVLGLFMFWLGVMVDRRGA